MLRDSLNERSRQLWAASEAHAVGYGGASLVARATGISWSTIVRGLAEAQAGGPAQPGRVRRPGGGRKRATAVDPRLPAALDALAELVSRGDPESPLRWTCKSTRVLARKLSWAGHPASEWLVRQLLADLGYKSPSESEDDRGPPAPRS